MTDKHTLIAFLATLLTIIILVGIGAWLAFNGKYSEALGVGGAVTGVIGIAGTFRPSKSPVAATGSGDVNVNSTPAQGN